MRVQVLIIGFMLATLAQAWDPVKCTGGLAYLLPKLEQKGLLQSPSREIPIDKYVVNGVPNLCIAKNNEQYNWLIHKHSDGVTVLIERYEFKTTNNTYYAPFKSAYNK